MKFRRILKEAIYAGRGWSGKISQVDDLMTWMYDKDIMSDKDKVKKDRIFNAYYRYYNDGDMPESLERQGFTANTPEMELELEKMITDFIINILKKYSGRYSRNEFRYDRYMSKLSYLYEILAGSSDGRFPANYSSNTLEFWTKDANIGDTKYLEIYNKAISTEKKLSALMNPIEKANRLDSNYVISARMKEIRKAGISTPAIENLYKELKQQWSEMATIISDLIIASKKLHDLEVI